MLNKNYEFPIKKDKYIKQFSKIVSTASYFPDKVVTNKDIILDNSLPFTESVIEKSIGVKERRVAPEKVCDSDLLSIVAKECLEKVSLNIENVSRVIVTTYLGDRLFPMTASNVLKNLNSKVAVHAFDFEGGTNAFLQVLDLSEKYINSGDEFILVLSGGITNKFISKTDPRTAFLFGDGVSAMLIGKAKSQHFIDSYFYSNFNHFNYAMGFTLEEMMTHVKNKEYSKLYNTYKLGNWKKVEDFYLLATDKIIEEVLSKNNLKIEDIDLFFITENNRPLKNSILKRLGISDDKTESILEFHGNLMTAMLPAQFDKAIRTKKLKKDMRVLFLSHGEGLSGGGILYNITEEI